MEKLLFVSKVSICLKTFILLSPAVLTTVFEVTLAL